MSFTLINISTYFNDDYTMERNLFALSVLASLLLVGCGDDKDSPATQNKTLSSETALNFADKDCWLGGQAIHTGLDKNGNGKLDADEIQNTKNQCNTENLFANTNGWSKQIFALFSSIGHFIYDISIGFVVVLRSLSQQITVTPIYSIIVVLGFTVFSFLAFSRLKLKLSRS